MFKMKCNLGYAGKIQETELLNNYGLKARQISEQNPQEVQGTADSVVKGFFSHFFDKRSVRRALKVALVVGPVLAFINHFDLCLGSDITTERIVKIVVTFIVPFCVSGYSSATTMMEDEKRMRAAGKTTVIDTRKN